MSIMLAKIAVSAAKYWLDKPYSYLVPEDMREIISPGKRVIVPFSRSNTRVEGLVLSLEETESISCLKSIINVADKEPILNNAQVRLALYMRERFFCTVYEAARCMIPSLLQLDDKGIIKLRERHIEIVSLVASANEVLSYLEKNSRRAHRHAEILNHLLDTGPCEKRELIVKSSRDSLKRLVELGMVGISLISPDELSAEKEKQIQLASLPILSDEQIDAYEGIGALLALNHFEQVLLQGVTGSGKTAVYLHLIRDIMNEGRSAILLVPEISLTPQAVSIFVSYFGDKVAVLHSALSPYERYSEWKRIESGRATVVIGTRSAVFAPVNNLGLIIIDEEQEDTYKSESSPRYNAVDIARFLCYQSGCVLLFGSATPNICTAYRAHTGEYHHFCLSTRYNLHPLPCVSIIDMKSELRSGNGGNISGFLFKELSRNIEEGEQSLLFLNRRGSNKCVSCASCGFTYACPNCSVSLRYHGESRSLRCHYCSYRRKVDTSCPECGGKFKYIGVGTQLVESELRGLFPNTELMRMDTDVLSASNTHEQMFLKFIEDNIPILIGTQMITKGLNFKNVTLVGVICADLSLYSGDYRSAERTFSMITQVIGRCGRGDKPGRAVVQTYTPENETLIQAASQDYESFYNSEILMRKVQGAPPFFDLIAFNVIGKDENRVIKACECLKLLLLSLLDSTLSARVLGPTPLGVVKVNNKYRYRVNLFCKLNADIRHTVSAALIDFNNSKEFSAVDVYADWNPLD